jgi:hypothetical protein
MSKARVIGLALAGFALAGCGDPELQRQRAEQRQTVQAEIPTESVFDLFRGDANPEQTVNVNRHLWLASLDTLAFLPLESADPFSGVISTGWGALGGDAAAYRATVLITSAALDARSLRVAAFRQQGGRAVPVGDAENRQIENAILTRARELRIAERGR